MSAFHRAFRPFIQKATTELNRFEALFALIPDSPEKTAAKEQLGVFHRSAADGVKEGGFNFTSSVEASSPTEIVVASVGSGEK